MPTTPLDNRGRLRQKIRKQRLLLTPRQRDLAATKACALIVSSRLFARANHIACYIPANGELDPLPALERALSVGKKCYLPVLRPIKQQRLWFARWQPGDALSKNRFGIPEPKRLHNKLIPAWALDLAITPLVAFDEAGNRLGMGGGYYDRSFAYLNRRQFWRKPILAGYGYEFQNCSKLKKEQWDVPLNLVVTDKRIHTTDNSLKITGNC